MEKGEEEMDNIISLLEKNPIIPAIRDSNNLGKIYELDNEIVFILTTNLIEVENLVSKLKESGKVVFIHIDLLDGLSSSAYALEYLKKNTKVDGIISTKHHMIKAAKNIGLITIQRFFLLDSLSFKNTMKYARENKPTAIELLPGLMPKVIKIIAKGVDIPIIAGGLVSDKEDIVGAIGAGAQAVSTTKEELWNL